MVEIPKIAFHKRKSRKLEFEIFTLRDLFTRTDIQDHDPQAPHRLQFYSIIIITEGKGSHFIDLKPYAYQPGSMLFISKGQVHAFRVDMRCDGFILLFTEQFINKNLIHSDVLSVDRLFNYHLHSSLVQPFETEQTLITDIVREIHREYQSPDEYGKEEILRSLLKVVLLKAERAKQRKLVGIKNSEWLNLFEKFKLHIEDNFSQTRNAVDYADLMNISYKHLNLICKSVTGSTAKNFIDQYIILEIKRRIATTDITIKELTYRFGFDEPTNLVKFFKKHTQVTPSQYKRSMTH